jgi:hypothetical protein
MNQYAQQRAELEKLKVPELKALLKARNQKVGGNKAELVDRLLGMGVATPPAGLAPLAAPLSPIQQLQTELERETLVLSPLPAVQPINAPYQAYAPRSPARSPARSPRVTKSPRGRKPAAKKPAAKKTAAKRSPRATRSPAKILAKGRTIRADLEALTIPQLKALLKARKEKVSGKKSELVDRVLASKAPKKAGEPAGPRNRQGDLEKLNVEALKSILRARYQKVTGKKAELVARILSGEGVGTQKPRPKSPKAAKSPRAKSPRAKSPRAPKSPRA